MSMKKYTPPPSYTIPAGCHAGAPYSRPTAPLPGSRLIKPGTVATPSPSLAYKGKGRG
jgi:hypothetical protein